MSATQISRRYANSLYALSQEQGSTDIIYLSLQNINDIIVQSSDFREFLNNPLLVSEEREKVLKAVFSGKVPDLLEKFLFFINQKNRLNILGGIIAAFDDIYLIAHNRVRAQVQVALPLEISVREKILEQLGKKYAKEVLATWQIRKEILGGFRILIEGNVHDYSFTNQLEHYRKHVLQ